jgi:hypothetical protein
MIAEFGSITDAELIFRSAAKRKITELRLPRQVLGDTGMYLFDSLDLDVTLKVIFAQKRTDLCRTTRQINTSASRTVRSANPAQQMRSRTAAGSGIGKSFEMG